MLHNEVWHEWQATLLHTDGTRRCVKVRAKTFSSAIFDVNDLKSGAEELISLFRMTGPVSGTIPDTPAPRRVA